MQFKSKVNDVVFTGDKSGIRNLTDNNLGMFGNVEQLFAKEAVNNFTKEHLQFIGLETTKKHTFVQELFLNKNDVESAWKVLLIK